MNKAKVNKLVLTNRWQEEKRDKVVSAFRAEVRERLMKEGQKLKEALEGSWIAARDEFPPLPKPKGPGATGNGKGIVVSRLPKSWKDLPETAPFEVEVEWVHQNRVLVVEERSRGSKSLLHWDRARKSAPSYGAVNLMEYAATNRKGFMDILQRVKPGDGGEEQTIRREKRSIADINDLLEQMAEVG